MKSKGLAFVFRVLLLPISILSYSYSDAQILSCRRSEEKYCYATDGSGGMNAFIIEIKYDKGKLNPTRDNLIVEFSDSEGNFGSPTTLKILGITPVNDTESNVTFEIPRLYNSLYLAGEKFRVRIKSTEFPSQEPLIAKTNTTSAFNEYFPAYAKAYLANGYSINNGVPTISDVCLSQGYEIKIDSGGTSPLNVTPSLSFQWMQQLDGNNVEIGKGVTFKITKPGDYFSRVNYGSCIDENGAKSIKVKAIAKGIDINISSDPIETMICPDQTARFSVISTPSVSDLVFKWYLNDVLIPNEVSNVYTSKPKEQGVFKATTTYDGCDNIATKELTIDKINSSIDKTVLVFPRGGFATVEVTSDAKNPKYEWFLEGVLIAGETTNTYNVSVDGNYKAVVTQTEGCTISDEFLFTGEEEVKPNVQNILTPNGDGINDVWTIPKTYKMGTNTQVQILDQTGKVLLDTKQYTNDWVPADISRTQVYYYIITPESGTPLKGTITVIK